MSQISIGTPALASCSQHVPNGTVRQVTTILWREVRDAFHNRWFLFFAGLFALLACVLSWLSMAGTGSGGVAGFGRTAAGLVNIVLLVVPLMALTVGAGTVAGERERGTLEYLLSHPISRTELLAGKYLGSAFALLTALVLGFSISILAVGRHGRFVHLGSFISLVVSTCILAMAMLSVGMLISVLSRRSSVAVGAAILVWFFLVFLTDLGLMGSTVAFRLQVQDLFWLSLLNPMQVFKMSVLGSIHASLDVLGPAGLYASRAYGPLLPLLFAASAAAWIFLPAGAAYVVFIRRGDA